MSASDFEERVITVPLRDVQSKPRTERADAAISIVRSHLAQHFSVDEEQVRLDPSINEIIWSRGRHKPPRRIRIRAARFQEEGVGVVEAEHAAT